MKYAAIYKRCNKLIFCPQGRSTAGVVIGVGDVKVIDASADLKTTGQTLREVIANSKSPVKHPKPSEWTAITATVINAAGVKSWGAFVRGALLTDVRADGRSFDFQPLENRGARDGFQPLDLPSVQMPAASSDEELGEALRRALAIAESREPRRVSGISTPRRYGPDDWVRSKLETDQTALTRLPR